MVIRISRNLFTVIAVSEQEYRFALKIITKDTSPATSCLCQLLDEDISRIISAELQLKNNIAGWVSNESTVPPCY